MAVVPRSTWTDDDGSSTVGSIVNNAELQKIYDNIDTCVTGLDNGVFDFRLSLTSGLAVTTADVTGAATVYLTPAARGNRAALHDGAKWQTLTSGEVAQALGTLVNAQAYDVFAYINAGVMATEILEWANAVVTMTIASPGVVTWTAHGMSTGMSITFTNAGGALPTGVTANTQYFITVIDANTFKLSTSLANVDAGTFINTTGSQSGTHTGHQPQARATALALQDGVLVKSGAPTRRYVGAFMTTSTTTTEDSAVKRLLSNHYNRVARRLLRQETTASWNYTLLAYRQANGSAANQVAVFVGVAEDELDLTLIAQASNGSNSPTILAAIGDNSTLVVAPGSVVATTNIFGSIVAGAPTQLVAKYVLVPAAGYHAYTWMEKSEATGNTTWQGTTGSGLSGLWRA